MLERLNKELIKVKEDSRKRDKLLENLTKVKDTLGDEKRRLKNLVQQLEKEDADVTKLEGLSLTAMFSTLLGNKDEKIAKEKQEYLAVKLKYDECKEAINYLEKEEEKLRWEISRYGDIENSYKSLIEEKERLILKADNVVAKEMLGLTEKIADLNADLKELKEAVVAGNEVLDGLASMIDSLKSAEGWGTWDMLGGGLISTAVKHSRIDEARDKAHRVQQLLRRFQHELNDTDINSSTYVDIEIGSFATFADYLFDGLITDWIVQSKIKDSLNNAISMESKVKTTQLILQRKLEDTEKEINVTKQEIQRLIEDAG